MRNESKYYTLFIEDGEIQIVNRQHILEQILYKLSMIYEYIDDHDDLIREHGRQLDEILEELQEKKNHNSSSNRDSLIQF